MSFKKGDIVIHKGRNMSGVFAGHPVQQNAMVPFGYVEWPKAGEDALSPLFGIEGKIESVPLNGLELDFRYTYDKKYGDYKVCKCGHPYYRHFDTYEDMERSGCKYCGCSEFKLLTGDVFCRDCGVKIDYESKELAEGTARCYGETCYDKDTDTMSAVFRCYPCWNKRFTVTG